VKVDGVSEQSGRILVVDDDETVRDVVRRYLELAGFTVDLAGDGAEGLRVFAERPPDLVVLDVMMPGINGLEVCKRLRQVSQVPIVMLTALGEEENRIAGLQLGADDYVTKPFSPKELALRVASVLRRARMPIQAPAAAELTDGNLTLQLGARQATLNGSELSRADLLEKVWGWDFGDQSTVTVHVRRLREKVERDPAKPVRVATVWGVGYRYDRGQS